MRGVPFMNQSAGANGSGQHPRLTRQVEEGGHPHCDNPDCICQGGEGCDEDCGCGCQRPECEGCREEGGGACPPGCHCPCHTSPETQARLEKMKRMEAAAKEKKRKE